MKKIMAVDDSRVSLLTVKRHLKDSAYDLVATVQAPAEAVDKYSEVQPDLVLLDVVMPEMDGVALLEKLIAHDATAKVIMVSSLGTKDKIDECLAKGATSFLMKPYDRDQLLKILGEAGGEAD